MAGIITVSWRNGCVSWPVDACCQIRSANCSTSLTNTSTEAIIYSGGLDG